jgi:general secretion pathway protein G
MKAKSFTRQVIIPSAPPARFRVNDLIAIFAIIVIGFFGVKHFAAGDNLSANAKTYMTQSIATALQSYKADTGSYPNTRQGLKALIEEPSNVSNWKGPYLADASALLDPWNISYQYSFPGLHNARGNYDLWSMGPDKMSATTDDISNW